MQKTNLDRKEKALELRRQGKKLREIGEVMGISRERVRQIIGKVELPSRREFIERFIEQHPDLTAAEIAVHLGVTESRIQFVGRGKRFAVKDNDSFVAHGNRVEKKMSMKLKQLGIENYLMHNNCKYDIELLNGKRVEVISTYRSVNPPSQYAPYYRFHINKAARGEYADFFLLVAGNEDAVYVVPNADLLPGLAEIRIPALADEERQVLHTSKYSKYLNQFELLKG